MLLCSFLWAWKRKISSSVVNLHDWLARTQELGTFVALSFPVQNILQCWFPHLASHPSLLGLSQSCRSTFQFSPLPDIQILFQSNLTSHITLTFLKLAILPDLPVNSLHLEYSSFYSLFTVPSLNPNPRSDFLCCIVLCCVVEISPHYVVQDNLKFMILLLQLPKCVLPHSAPGSEF